MLEMPQGELPGGEAHSEGGRRCETRPRWRVDGRQSGRGAAKGQKQRLSKMMVVEEAAFPGG